MIVSIPFMPLLNICRMRDKKEIQLAWVEGKLETRSLFIRDGQGSIVQAEKNV